MYNNITKCPDVDTLRNKQKDCGLGHNLHRQGCSPSNAPGNEEHKKTLENTNDSMSLDSGLAFVLQPIGLTIWEWRIFLRETMLNLNNPARLWSAEPDLCTTHKVLFMVAISRFRRARFTLTTWTLVYRLCLIDQSPVYSPTHSPVLNLFSPLFTSFSGLVLYAKPPTSCLHVGLLLHTSKWRHQINKLIN